MRRGRRRFRRSRRKVELISMATTLIQHGRIITAVDDYVADVFIDGETVRMIGTGLPVKADRVIDATGKLVIPGAIDPHVHMELPFGGTVSSDDFESGTP